MTGRAARACEASEKLTIRPARLADARALARIHVRAWREGYRDIMPASLLRSLSVARRNVAWSRALRARGADVLVAEAQGGMLGWIAVGRSRDADADASTGELWSITVDPPAWRLGVGRELWRAGAECLRAAGSREVTLWVLEDNARARRFYTALGFAIDAGRQKPFEQGGARLVEVRVRKALGPPDGAADDHLPRSQPVEQEHSVC